MKFLDIAKVYASSGAGGNGCTERGQEKWLSGFPSGRATRKEAA